MTLASWFDLIESDALHYYHCIISIRFNLGSGSQVGDPCIQIAANLTNFSVLLKSDLEDGRCEILIYRRIRYINMTKTSPGNSI